MFLSARERSSMKRSLALPSVAVTLAVATAFFVGTQFQSPGRPPAQAPAPDHDSVEPAVPGHGELRGSATSSTSARAPIPGSHRAIPLRHALVPGLHVPLASSWKELLDALAPKDREFAAELAKAYPEAYQFSTPEQLAWMLENGYPMPEEYVIASRMELSQLEAMGNSGNTKAAMLAYDRIVSELVADDALLAGPEDERMGRLSELERAMQKSGCSPFPYLMQGRRELARSERGSQRSQVQEMYGALASYAVASNLGERRIDAMLRQISAGLPQEPHTMADVAKLAAHYRARSASDCNAGRIPR
jgi:hypothetical protein